MKTINSAPGRFLAPALALALAMAGACACAAPTPAQAAAKAKTTPVKITLHDDIGVDWHDELIHETLNFKPGELTGAAQARVANPAGVAIASQTDDVQRYPDGSLRSFNLWFCADLPANGTAVYSYLPGRPSPAAGSLSATATADTITLKNSQPRPLGIVLPAGHQQYLYPVAATDGVPGPIQGLLLPSGARTGAGVWHVPFRVKSYDAEITANGPLFIEAQVKYIFDVGYWNFTARLQAGSPLIIVHEELDTGDSGEDYQTADRFYTMPLGGTGFAPTQAFYSGRSKGGDYSSLLNQAIQTIFHKGASETASAGTYINGFKLSFDTPRTDYYLTPWPTWSPQVGSFVRYVQPGGDAIGVGSIKTIDWRNPLGLRFEAPRGGPAQLALPLQKYVQGWQTDGFAGHSSNYTGRSLFVPPTTLRRNYGIMLSVAEDETTAQLGSLLGASVKLGSLPLDEVKDMVLQWKDPMAGAKWSATGSPEGDKALDMMRYWVKLKRATGNFGTYSMWTYFTLTRGRYATVKAVIDSPDKITWPQRQELRRLCALQAYDLNSLDEMPWGAGPHLGNPNMLIMSVQARVFSGMLIPDHPMVKTWGAWTLGFMRQYLQEYVRSSGAPYENPHYTIGVTLVELAEANQTLMDAGIGDALQGDLFKKEMEFILNWLSPPELRFKGHRVILPLGNASYQSVPPEAANALVGYFQTRDPQLAGKLEWWANQTLPVEKQLKLVPEVVPQLTSHYFKDYGVFFRHGYGTPYETLFHFMAGNCNGHYENETDQMTYTYYAKGQPINLSFGNGYFPQLCRPWLRNRMSIDHKAEVSERHDAQIVATSFAPEAEYAHATKDVDQIQSMETEYPTVNPKSHQGTQPYPPPTPIETIPLTTIQRQVLFVKDNDPKGPNYFVLRDTTTGSPTRDTDLSFWFLANSMTHQGDTYHFDGQVKVDMDLFVNSPSGAEAETGDYSHTQQPYARLTGFDPAWFPGGVLGEKQLFVRFKQAPGKGYMVVLYPRLKEGDPAAQFTSLQENAVLTRTTLSDDYSFLDNHGFTFKDARVAFSGTAASVRFFKDGAIAVNNCEGHADITVAGKHIVGDGAFRVSIRGAAVTAEKLDDGAVVEVK